METVIPLSPRADINDEQESLLGQRLASPVKAIPSPQIASPLYTPKKMALNHSSDTSEPRPHEGSPASVPPATQSLVEQAHTPSPPQKNLQVATMNYLPQIFGSHPPPAVAPESHLTRFPAAPLQRPTLNLPFSPVALPAMGFSGDMMKMFSQIWTSTPMAERKNVIGGGEEEFSTSKTDHMGTTINDLTDPTSRTSPGDEVNHNSLPNLRGMEKVKFISGSNFMSPPQVSMQGNIPTCQSGSRSSLLINDKTSMCPPESLGHFKRKITNSKKEASQAPKHRNIHAKSRPLKPKQDIKFLREGRAEMKSHLSEQTRGKLKKSLNFKRMSPMQDDSSSSNGEMLDSSNVFDEDLEPLDLSKRDSLVGDGLRDQRRNGGWSEEEGSPHKLFIDLGMEQSGSKNPVEGRQQLIDKDENERLKSGCKSLKDGLMDEGKRSPSPSVNLPLKKRAWRNISVKSRIHTNESNKSDSFGICSAVRNNLKINQVPRSMCHRCFSDYRATSLVRCPVCSATAMIQNCTATSNSSLPSVASLPFQIGLCRKDDSITLVANSVIKSHTLLGPITGEPISTQDITKDMDVSYLWVVGDVISMDMDILSTRNEMKSNWLRYIKVGQDLSSYNLALIRQRKGIYFITMQKINTGQELLLRPLDPLIVHYNMMQESSCSLCRLTCASPLHLAKHRLFFHPFLQETLPALSNPHHQVPAPVQCLSEATLNKSTQRASAKKEDGDSMIWFCFQCKSHFKSKAGYRAHMSIVHKYQSNTQVMLPSFHCQDCSATFRSPWSLHRHTKTHALMAAGNKTFSCPQCGREFWRKQSFRRHVQAHQANELQLSPTCVHCGRKFYSSSNLKVHMLTHSGVKPFTCAVPQCNVGFTTKQSLQFHYIKRHGFFYETMPAIERNVPFTFEDYCGSKTDDIKTEISDECLLREAEIREDEGYKTKEDDLSSEVSLHKNTGHCCESQIMECETTVDPACQSESGILDSSTDRTS